MRILRHQIAITDYQVLDLPARGQLLSVAKSRVPELVNGALDLWSLDHEYGDPRQAAVYVIGTGNPMPRELRDSQQVRFDYEHRDGFIPAIYIPPENVWRHFIGTVVTPCGLVWHVFEGPVQ